MRVKICGIKRLIDGQLAIESGADAIGFLVGQLHRSSDFISPDFAASIIKALPPFCSTVLVTHLADPQEIIYIAAQTCCSTLQLHGGISVNDAMEIRRALPYLKVYKAIHGNDKDVFEQVSAWSGCMDALLVDTAAKEQDKIGGTGIVHDWNVTRRVVEMSPIPIILAGGLTPENVVDAITKVLPYAVDVNSGTKAEDGYKDPAKLKSFIQNAKRSESR